MQLWNAITEVERKKIWFSMGFEMTALIMQKDRESLFQMLVAAAEGTGPGCRGESHQGTGYGSKQF